MSKTPRTDVNEVEITGYAMSPRHYVRSEIARQLETELADARAEIERLKLVSQNQETVIAAQRRSAKAKNELIERMRGALSILGRIWFYGDFKPETPNEKHLSVMMKEMGFKYESENEVLAALAAERGEG